MLFRSVCAERLEKLLASESDVEQIIAMPVRSKEYVELIRRFEVVQVTGHEATHLSKEGRP